MERDDQPESALTEFAAPSPTSTNVRVPEAWSRSLVTSVMNAAALSRAQRRAKRFAERVSRPLPARRARRE